MPKIVLRIETNSGERINAYEQQVDSLGVALHISSVGVEAIKKALDAFITSDIRGTCRNTDGREE